MKRIEDIVNKIHCCDCLDFMRDMPDNCVDLVLTDPPYGINMDYDNYNDTFDNWQYLIKDAIDQFYRICKGFILIPTSKIEGERFLYNMNPFWRICWYKGSTGARTVLGFKDWEMIFVFTKHPKNLFIHDYFKYTPKTQKEFKHPCPKPDEWGKWCIDKFSDQNDIVFDPFLGSGTTAVACAELDRQFIGVEISQEYCDIAQKRVDAVMNQTKLKLE